jgi:hypothetical protein
MYFLDKEIKHSEVAVWLYKGKTLALPVGDGWRWVDAREMTTLAFPKIYHPAVSVVYRMLELSR